MWETRARNGGRSRGRGETDGELLCVVRCLLQHLISMWHISTRIGTAASCCTQTAQMVDKGEARKAMGPTLFTQATPSRLLPCASLCPNTPIPDQTTLPPNSTRPNLPPSSLAIVPPRHPFLSHTVTHCHPPTLTALASLHPFPPRPAPHPPPPQHFIHCTPAPRPLTPLTPCSTAEKSS